MRLRYIQQYIVDHKMATLWLMPYNKNQRHIYDYYDFLRYFINKSAQNTIVVECYMLLIAKWKQVCI